jgi:hypothetical protein
VITLTVGSTAQHGRAGSMRSPRFKRPVIIGDAAGGRSRVPSMTFLSSMPGSADAVDGNGD